MSRAFSAEHPKVLSLTPLHPDLFGGMTPMRTPMTDDDYEAEAAMAGDFDGDLLFDSEEEGDGQ